VSIYAAIILSGVFLDGSSPLVYELVCEAAYPVGEGVACSFLQMLFALAGILFTSVQEIPNLGNIFFLFLVFVQVSNF
jgi:FLVCR family MFS transporter